MTEMQSDAVGFALGAVLTAGLAYLAGKPVHRAGDELGRTSRGDDIEAALSMLPSERKMLWVQGIAEALIFMISFWLGAYVIAGGWLTFKTASKWDTWSHIVHVPRGRGQLRSRHRMGSLGLQRWLTGTALQGLVGFTGAGAAHLFTDYLRHNCPCFCF